MSRFKVVPFLFVVAVMMVVRPGSALADPATEKYVAEFAQRLIVISSRGTNEEARRRPFYGALARYTDLSRVARVALGRYRRSLPDEHRSAYRKLVTDFVADTLVEYSDGFRNAKLQIRSTRKSGNAMIVRTSVNNSTVRWRVRNNGGRLHVTDVSLGGIWLSIGLRGRFTAILDSKNGDFDALLKYLRENST